MSISDSSSAVRKTVTVSCRADKAFRIWTEQINDWWPRGHSRSGNPATTVLLESHVGGRIYERTPEGIEHDWGKITVWDPPGHFAYHWYLGSGPERPTQVDVRFVAEQEGTTRVDVTHQGPALIDELWSHNSSIYDAAWENLLPAYAAACETD